MSERLATELTKLLGERGFIALAEAFGGRRLYVPTKVDSDGEIAKAIGLDAARLLSRRKSPDYLRVPLAREVRARHYRAAGFSNGAIATKLGMTETGVNHMFARMDSPPVKGSEPERQFSLF
ncbi:hypothetical protein [Sphingobium cloacae]|uniref:Uncharacterized protein n=1 Tax=Sphingobium cloacae TaxID=120107 RepID=A0A1E1F2V7_9SPHN|nr:hypothetical protein [Sphingobium cloacae]BAV64781.1 hypothetical protein SCLO_1017410 [Sphingobium cloacae]